MSVNKVTIIGNLGVDPEIRIMPNGDHTATLSIATSRYWKDQITGESKELVEWHRIVLYRRLAEIARDYLKKGSKVYIDGYLRTQKWTDNNGINRWTTNIVAEDLQLLDSKPKTKSEQPVPPEDVFDNGEIPF
ncbi:TPA: single-stranded DNA-binding protein [Pasteurella multocida]|nr:single-stranded DNA-binding protein [Pasteurella multocida]HDR1868159.1 single-stranded DNA-binding protein [Pasteurella multocida]HED4417323.1 single-stranded DNA-binding protein [Pasteurella multocida]HED4466390.1 single-stranded DNA-binding protein [Pasteurella multocida]HED4467865.1 single-stranded DNA-binding protein [Pasteurella multocida]